MSTFGKKGLLNVKNLQNVNILQQNVENVYFLPLHFRYRIHPISTLGPPRFIDVAWADSGLRHNNSVVSLESKHRYLRCLGHKQEPSGILCQNLSKIGPVVLEI